MNRHLAGGSSGREAEAQGLRECLYRVGRFSEQIIELEPLLLAIIQECASLLKCEASSIALYDAQNNDLIFTVATGRVGGIIRQWRMPLEEGVVGWVARQRQPYYANNPHQENIWSAKIDEATGFATRSLAAVPMIRKEMLIGVLEAVNCLNLDGFTQDDLELMQLFADQASLAIEIHRLIAARQHSERLAAFGVALADIGHNIKNILMRLEFPVHLIDKGIEQQNWELLSGGWPSMKRATQEIGSLVREMLEYSKSEKPFTSEVNVAALAGEVVQQCRCDTESKGIALSVLGLKEDLIWTIDPTGLKYALHNLIGNAIEAIAEYGGSAVNVALALEESGAALRITVADDGPGIPSEIQRRIFDPFFTTKKSKGTGLGLANVKKNVEAHGGRVLLSSEPGNGTAFTLCYPRLAQV